MITDEYPHASRDATPPVLLLLSAYNALREDAIRMESTLVAIRASMDAIGEIGGFHGQQFKKIAELATQALES